MAARGNDVRQLLLQVDASVELARRNLGQLRQQVATDAVAMDRSLGSVDGATGRLGTAFGRLSGAAATLGVTIGVGTIVAAGRSVLEFADNLDASAQRAGVAVERYQTLREAFRSLEVSRESTDRLLQRLRETLGDLQNGVDNEASKALDRLGIKSRVLNGEITTSDGLLDALAQSSTRAGTQAQYLSEVSAILGGRLAREVTPALMDGGAALRAMEQDVRNTGTVIDEQMIQKLADANEAIDRFTELSQRQMTIWAADFIGALGSVNDAVLRFSGKLQQGLANLPEPPPWLLALLATNPVTLPTALLGAAIRPADRQQGWNQEFRNSSNERQVEMARQAAARALRERNEVPQTVGGRFNVVTRQTEPGFNFLTGRMEGPRANPEWQRRNEAYQRLAQAADRLATAAAAVQAGEGGAAATVGGNQPRPPRPARTSRSSASERDLVQFGMPVDGQVTSGYGLRARPNTPNGTGSRFHQGIDIAAGSGTTIRAPAAGTVEAIGYDPGLGKYIVINHGSGTRTRYGHLSQNDAVSVGDVVDRGEAIGKTGNTGRSSGPHLHYEVTVNGRAVDPRTGRFPAQLAEAVGEALRNRPPAEASLEEMWERFHGGASGVSASVLGTEPLSRIGGDGSFEDMKADLEAALGTSIDIRDTLAELPNIADIMPAEDQERLLDFSRSLRQDLADGLTQAIVYGENLGDVLINTFRRAAAELISSSLMDLLSGRSPKDSMLGQLIGTFGSLGGLFGGGSAQLNSSINSIVGSNNAALTAGLTGRAYGGPMWAGQAYMTGENGPEIIVPRTPSVVIPNHAAGRFGGAAPVVNVYAKDAVLTHQVRRWVAEGMSMAMVGGSSDAQSRLQRRANRTFPSGGY